MRDIRILHDLLKKQCPQIHQKRLNSLVVATEALLDGNQLSLTQLGRNISGSVAPKHNIKRIDRLLGNPHLVADKFLIYRWHALHLCGANPMPVILVDWSDVREQLRMMTLRASVSVQGRSVTLYERTFLFEDYNAPRSHNAFLAELAKVLPPRCCPLIVTDAGYRNTWFREVERHGWFWLGRVRGDVSYQPCKQSSWYSNKSLYPKATSIAKHIGQVRLARKAPLLCNLHLYKAKPKSRKDTRSSKAGRNHTAQKSYRLGSKEPWLLATNLPPESFPAVKIVALYAKRMQIEETFRDLKSPQYGMGLRQSRSKDPRRYDVLLLIAMLAEMLLWCIGIAAMHLGWQRHFQANTIINRAVLSIVRLGKEVRRRPKYQIKESTFRWAMVEYIKRVHAGGMPGL
ncbi:IS4 family transposase [Shewanella sp. AS16]|uniref:IS4 family transposase n=1 Tax=Shewanella sp. AS16 TaxID=2907625 RepID=UPI001F3A1B60|nr:IS4 family transposase [Shewanella sp. AS16]MCE9684612.1 IS4 family transposase [Shewanella sp. AS16]